LKRLTTKLRKGVGRFKTIGKTLQKLFSPNLEKALTFLDDSLLSSTSNAVERNQTIGVFHHAKAGFSWKILCNDVTVSFKIENTL